MCFQLKQMELQLEEEYEEKQKVTKERRELESKLLSVEDRVSAIMAAGAREPRVSGCTCLHR